MRRAVLRTAFPALGTLTLLLVAAAPAPPKDETANWPQFRGPFASGESAGPPTPVEWNLDTGTNVRWRTPVPGLGHAAPVVWGDKLFITTAVSDAGDQSLKPGLYGDIAPANDAGEFAWKVLCLDKTSGKVLWEQTGHRGVPKTKRHTKATQANSTPAADGERVVAFFGSEGLYAYDHAGKPLWQKDFGVLRSGFYMVPDAEWGFATSTVLYDGKVVVQVDAIGAGFLACLDAKDGKELWRTPRHDLPTWATPTLHRHPGTGGVQVICNGSKEMAGYDFATGKQLWKLHAAAGDIPVPTPVARHGLIFLTSATARPRRSTR